MPRVNFKATAAEFTLLPNSNYPVRIESVEFTKSQAGNDMLNMTYVLFSAGEFDGRKLFDRLSLLPQAGWKLKNVLEAAQVVHSAIPGAGKGEFDIDFDTDDCIGHEIVVNVGQETYQTKQLDANGQPKMAIRNVVNGYQSVA